MTSHLSRADDPDQIRVWIAVAEKQVELLANEADRVQYQLAQARKRLTDLYELLAAATHSPIAVSAKQLGLARSVRDRVLDSAEEILREAGHPLSITQIHAEFVRRGHPLPGRGTPTNIVAHLITKPDRFEKRSRGVYALAEWAGTNDVADSAASGEGR